MILDSSAIVAVLCQEAGFERLLEKIERASVVTVGAPTVFEAAMVLTSKLKQDGLTLVHEFLRETSISVTPFRDQHIAAAFDAYLRFGKGRHRAALNFGDCLSYAMASVSNLPLLYLGNDFARTDIRTA